MGNMSYCRFSNTVDALEDCAENMNEPCSREEHKARKRLLRTIREIADTYPDEGLDDGLPVRP